jgi:hypothetical protein
MFEIVETHQRDSLYVAHMTYRQCRLEGIRGILLGIRPLDTVQLSAPRGPGHVNVLLLPSTSVGQNGHPLITASSQLPPSRTGGPKGVLTQFRPTSPAYRSLDDV